MWLDMKPETTETLQQRLTRLLNDAAAEAEKSPMIEKTRTEYRVVGTERRSGHEWEGQPHTERPAPWDLSALRSRNDNVRIQSRTVTETPWQDIDESEES